MATKLSITLYYWTMNEQLVPFGGKLIFIFSNYWTLSHIMCLKSHWISGTKNYFDRKMNNWYVLGPIFIFIIFLIDALWNSLKNVALCTCGCMAKALRLWSLKQTYLSYADFADWCLQRHLCDLPGFFSKNDELIIRIGHLNYDVIA